MSKTKSNRKDFSIAAVERDVGLSKDVLRVWERRYGFPAPSRDDKGERLYPSEQVERLRLIKRLMDQGHRPGRLLSVPPEELDALASARRVAATSAEDREDLADLVTAIQRHESDAYVQAVHRRLARQGLQRFVQDTVAPMTQLIGQAWEDGHLQVFEEHLFSELTERVLRQATAAVPAGHEPRVLLTTLSNEQHAMGLLMVEAMLVLEGAHCISLGTQTPMTDIVRAAAAHRADIVALSFSTAFPNRQIPELLAQLRAALPARTSLWAGGGGVNRVPAPQGVLVFATLDEAVRAVGEWRRARG